MRSLVTTPSGRNMPEPRMTVVRDVTKPPLYRPDGSLQAPAGKPRRRSRASIDASPCSSFGARWCTFGGRHGGFPGAVACSASGGFGEPGRDPHRARLQDVPAGVPADSGPEGHPAAPGEGRFHCPDGAFRVWKVDALEPDRRTGPTDLRDHHDRPEGDLGTVRGQAGALEGAARRFYLSALQPDSGADGAGERRAAVAFDGAGSEGTDRACACRVGDCRPGRPNGPL